jgi:hypothetical protein
MKNKDKTNIKGKLEIMNKKVNKNKVKKTLALTLVAMLTLGRYTTEASLVHAYASNIQTTSSATVSKTTSADKSSKKTSTTSTSNDAKGDPPKSDTPAGNPPAGNPPSGNPPAAPPNGGAGGPGASSSKDIKYTASTKITSKTSQTGKKYTSSTKDKSALLISTKDKVTINKPTVNNTKRNGNATFLDTIMIYQSMSGDSASGTSSFTANGGSITSKGGHVFHVTNTNAVISLNNVKIKNTDKENIPYIIQIICYKAINYITYF